MEDFIAKVTISWYNENRRILPWRETCDPYLIWVSEVIMQQTRIAQGLDYFNRFVERFPTVKSLSEASEDEVLKYWEGLGYYSRARNLHAAARDIMVRFKGEFPKKYEDVLSLKGIGDYSAAAICSFAWKQPYAVLDGNVYRVLSRFFAMNIPIDSSLGKKIFTELANKLLDKKHPDLYNQAIMDFGALQCTVKSPKCDVCPLMEKCIAFAEGNVSLYPTKIQKTEVKDRFFNYLHVTYNGETLLRQRGENDIWCGLYEFPMIETEEATDLYSLQQMPEYQRLFEKVELVIHPVVEMPRHQLSHQTIYSKFYEIEINNLNSELSQYTLAKDFEKFAMSRLITLYLEK